MIDLSVLAPPDGPRGAAMSIGRLLVAGLDELSAEDERAVCDQPSMVASIVDAVDRLTGFRVHVVDHGLEVAVAFALPDRTWASFEFNTPSDVWFDESATGSGRPVGRTLGHRSAIVGAQLLRFQRSPTTVEDFIALPHHSWVKMLDLRHVLPMWWEARISEGQTPESARMLLGLTLAPNTWPHLCWDKPGPPTLPVPDIPDTSAPPHL